MSLLSRFRMRAPDLPQLPPDEPATTQRVVVKRGRQRYQAATLGNLTASWTTTPLTSDQEVFRNWRTLVARSREQYQNNEFARKFISMCKNHIVGPKGFTMQARTKNRQGGLDARANTQIESAWCDWGRVGNCDVTGKLSWIDIQNLLVAGMAIDGESLARIHRGAAYGPYGIQLQILDPVLLDIEFNRDERNGNFIRFGIEFNGFGRPVAYHLNTFLNTSASDSGYAVALKRDRVPADQIIHLFDAERAGQKRGIPWLATSMFSMQMLNAFEEAAVINARMGASKMGFYENAHNEEFEGDDVDDDGAVVDEIEPGVMQQVGAGFKMHSFDTRFPDTQMGPFSKVIKQRMASGALCSYNSMANDLEGVNFSSMRHGALEERENWMRWQEMVRGSGCDPIYRAWIAVQVELMRTVVHDGPVFPKFSDVLFQPRRWAWVDPKSESVANANAVEMGSKTVSSIIRESGGDPDEVFDERAEELKKMRDRGIPIKDPNAAKQVNENEQDEPEDEDQEG